jgi:hypothetical protein
VFKRRRPLALPGAALACALTVLSHPEVAWFLCASALLLVLFFGRDRQGATLAAVIGLAVIVLCAPWWWTNLARHGLGTFFAPFQVQSQEGSALVRLILFSYSEEAFTDILGALAILGLLAELASRRYLLAAWVALIVFLSLRNAPYILMIPVALLAGAALDQLVLPGLARLGFAAAPSEQPHDAAKRRNPRARLAVLAILLFYLAFSAAGFAFTLNPSLRRLSTADQEAMAWARAQTPPESRFALATGEEAWEIDPLSEWFPALSGRSSLATVQGSEWSAGGYTETQAGYHALQNCLHEDVGCLETWLQQRNVQADYVYLADSQKELPLYRSLNSSDVYEIVFYNSGVVLFERVR